MPLPVTRLHPSMDVCASKFVNMCVPLGRMGEVVRVKICKCNNIHWPDIMHCLHFRDSYEERRQVTHPEITRFPQG